MTLIIEVAQTCDHFFEISDFVVFIVFLSIIVGHWSLKRCLVGLSLKRNLVDRDRAEDRA